MALTLEEAQTRLSNIDTGDTEALKNLINELSVEASGSKTILPRSQRPRWECI